MSYNCLNAIKAYFALCMCVEATALTCCDCALCYRSAYIRTPSIRHLEVVLRGSNHWPWALAGREESEGGRAVILARISLTLDCCH